MTVYSELKNSAKICIYGCGSLSKYISALIQQNRPDIEIICYIDSNKNGYFNNRKMIKIDDFCKENYKYDYIYILSAYYEEIIQTLEKYGLKNYLYFHNLKIEKCPVCGEENVADVDGYQDIKKCPTCNHTYKSTVLDLQDTVKSRYDKIDYWYSDRIHQGITSMSSYFDETSNQWTDFINSRMQDLIRFNMLTNLDKQKSKIMEIGCSEGVLVRKLIDEGYSAFGIEANPEIVKNAIYELNVPIINTSAEDFILKDSSVDRIISYHVFEHLINPKVILEKCSKLLRKNGKILICVPIDDGEFNNEDHYHFFNLESMTYLMKEYFANIDYEIKTYTTANKDVFKEIVISGTVKK